MDPIRRFVLYATLTLGFFSIPNLADPFKDLHRALSDVHRSRDTNVQHVHTAGRGRDSVNLTINSLRTNSPTSEEIVPIQVEIPGVAKDGTIRTLSLLNQDFGQFPFEALGTLSSNASAAIYEILFNELLRTATSEVKGAGKGAVETAMESLSNKSGSSGHSTLVGNSFQPKPNSAATPKTSPTSESKTTKMTQPKNRTTTAADLKKKLQDFAMQHPEFASKIDALFRLEPSVVRLDGRSNDGSPTIVQYRTMALQDLEEQLALASQTEEPNK